jgi:hypothetical protein
MDEGMTVGLIVPTEVRLPMIVWLASVGQCCGVFTDEVILCVKVKVKFTL